MRVIVVSALAALLASGAAHAQGDRLDAALAVEAYQAGKTKGETVTLNLGQLTSCYSLWRTWNSAYRADRLSPEQLGTLGYELTVGVEPGLLRYDMDDRIDPKTVDQRDVMSQQLVDAVLGGDRDATRQLFDMLGICKTAD